MVSIVSQETIEAIPYRGIIKYLFRYTLSNGQVYYSRAWLSPQVNSTIERTNKGIALLEQLAEDETNRILK